MCFNYRQVSLNALRTVFIEGDARISDEPRRLQHIRCDDWFEYVKFKMTSSATHRHGHIVSHHLCAHHSQRFRLGGVDFPWHNGRSWFIVRNDDLPNAAPRTRAEHSYVVSHLHQGYCGTLQRAREFYHRIVGRERFKLVGSSDKWIAREIRNLSRNQNIVALGRVKSSAHRCATKGQFRYRFP